MSQVAVRVEKKSGENWKVRVSQDGQTKESEFSNKEDAKRYAKVEEKRLGIAN
ncbi:hypothetical protein [Tianweitania sediminis]|uniref:DUF2188 domain-containing protein n=1 Tax=Tianweitania sediminis TaxID=1502156 RepID=A0A8J7RKT4_9HYPH|nr:hypothetical protein [Tianweitania sediminis]MBP0439041.1 hypothetical protein [Tianweitania sediminis]